MPNALKAISKWWKESTSSVEDYLSEPEYVRKPIPQIPGESVLVRRNPKEVRERKLNKAVDIAMAPQGGMLKVQAIPKLMSSIYKLGSETGVQPFPSKTAKLISGLMKTPEEEFEALKSLRSATVKEATDPVKGLYKGWFQQSKREIMINPYIADKLTVPHEFAHLRTWYPKGTAAEKKAAELLAEGTYRLQFALVNAPQQKASLEEFYSLISPTENTARDFAEVIAELPVTKEFYNRAFQNILNANLEGMAETYRKYNLTVPWANLLKDLGIQTTMEEMKRVPWRINP